MSFVLFVVFGARSHAGQLGGARGRMKMLRVQGREKKFSRAAESAQWRSSRHSELSGESHGGRRGGRGQRHFPGNHFIHTLKHFPLRVLFTLQTAVNSRGQAPALGGLTLKSWFILQRDLKKKKTA